MEATARALPCPTAVSAPREGSDLFGHDQQVELRWRLEPAGVWLQVVRGDTVGLEIRLQAGRPARLEQWTGDGSPGDWRWHMLRGLPLKPYHRDLFCQVASTIHWGLYNSIPSPGPRPASERWPKEVRRRKLAEASSTMREVHQRLRELAVHAAGSCDPQARQTVLRFCPHLRFPLYQRLLDDPRGRLEQLTDSCPGALIFAFGLIEQGGTQAEVGETLLPDRVQEGVRLPRLLDEALEGWAAGASQASLGLSGQAWLPLAGSAGAKWARYCQQQKLLIRRAGRQVATTHLWLPPPLAYTPEDIPGTTRANARWFKVMKGQLRMISLDDPATEPVLRALSRFASRQSERLYRASSPRHGGPGGLAWLHDYLLATGRRPGRNHDPVALLAEARIWHERLHRPGGGQGAGELEPGAAAALRLPQLPDSAWSHGGLEVQPMTTALELAEEGKRMHHCVATRLSAALACRSFLFRAEMEGQRLTVEVVQQSGRLFPGDIRGLSNREPSRTELEALQPWLTGLCGRPISVTSLVHEIDVEGIPF